MINNRSYGIWMKNVLRAMNYLGYEYSFFPHHPIDLAQDEGDLQLPIQAGINRAYMYDPNGDSVQIWHEFDLGRQVGKRRVAWTLFELDRLNEQQKHHLRSQDVLVLPSEWHISIARAEGLGNKTLKTCPLGVNTSIFFPKPDMEMVSSSFGGPMPVYLKRPDKTIFISVGKWEKRKGHDVLPRVFAAAFSPQDKVELHVSHNNPFLTEDEVIEWKKLYSVIPRHQIRFLDGWQSDQMMNHCYNAADAGICLSRAEGWGLPNLEMLACGLPLIATNYAAHTEYLTERNARLVHVHKSELARDGKWFVRGNGSWASLERDQEDQAIEHLRQVHKEKQEKGKLFNQAGLDTAQELTWFNAVQKLMEILQE